MSTTIEQLELEIESNSTSAVAGIEALAQSLGKIRDATKGGLGLKSVANSMKAINVANVSDSTQKIQDFVDALAPLSQLSKSNLSSFVNPLKKLPEVFTELNKIDMSAFSAKIQDVATAMKPLADEMEKVANGFSAFPAKIQKLLKANNGIPSSNKKVAASFTDVYHKLKTIVNGLKVTGDAIYSFIKKSSQYNEVVNLFSTSLGQYASAAYDTADTLDDIKGISDIMGIDPSEWMKSQGVFMTLATGFGVAGDRAYKMSQQLTQLGYDISSFQDISVEEAMQKLQSGLSGELEPLRRIGYDLSQAKLEATAMALGIDKSVSSMTQAEKAQLRYYAIMTQVTQQQGDMARTLDDPANQMRIFSAQVSIAAREIGNMFIPALQAILPYATAAVKVIGSLASVIAGLFGYEAPTIEDKGIANLASGAESASDSLEDATESAKKLKSYMLGFDELNVINPNEGSSSSANDALGEFDFELPEYDFMDGAVSSKVTTIVEEMKEWLGITDDIDSWSELFDTRLGNILITVGAIGIGFAAWEIGVSIYSFITSLSSLSGVSTVLSGIGTSLSVISAPVLAVVAAILAVVVGLAAVYATNEEVRTSINNAVKDIGESLKPLLEFITSTILPNLKSAWEGLVEILTPFGEWLAMVFASIWEDMIIPALEWISSTAIPKATEAFENLWNNVLVPLGEFLGSVLAPVISIVSDVLTQLWQYVVVPLAEFLGGIFTTVWESIVKIFNESVIPHLNRVITVLQFLWNNVLLPIINVLQERFAPVFETVFKHIGEIIGAAQKVFTGLITFVTGIFTKDWEQAWEGLSTIFSGIWDGMVAGLKFPLNLALSNIEGFINAIIEGWNSLKRGINSLSIKIPEWLGGGTLGFNLGMTGKITLPRFAEGGFPEQGQMFIAREAGAEMVGNIGRRTAVANNDQIVAGIAGGVAEANEEQNVLLREQNSLLRAILEKDSGVYLDGKNLTNSVEKYQRERGRVLITGGVL